MKAEYFPPKEDVILQNEAPTDFYVLVTGSAVINQSFDFPLLFQDGLVKLMCEIFFTGPSSSQEWS